MATNGSYTMANDNSTPGPADSASASGAAGTNNNSNLSKDEVGWYFVEQYYTTLSKNPEKLHVRMQTTTYHYIAATAQTYFVADLNSSFTASDPSSFTARKPRLPMFSLAAT